MISRSGVTTCKQAIADNKHEDPRVFRQHLLLYAIPFLIAALYLQLDRQFLAAALLAVLLHSLIDLGKRAAGKSPVYFMRDEGKLYGLDQLLHMVSLIALAMAFKIMGVAFALDRNHLGGARLEL